MPYVIPVFIPHQGCPHSCTFCNQYRITGSSREARIDGAAVGAIIRKWLARGSVAGREVQVAFYGGSFTGLARSRQEELLTGATPFVREGAVAAIRLSTRPDYVDGDTVSFLRRHNVSIVELGVQSLDDAVLEACNRGHSAARSIRSVRLLQEGGFRVGVQLMLGLPLQTQGSLMRTVREVAVLQPDFVRIYPVLVLKGSRLAISHARGEYRPLSLGAAVVMAAKAREHLERCGIRVVRMGLQAGEELERNLLAGPWHPAFGEMVDARLMFRKTRKILRGAEGRVVLTINERDRSKFRGIRSANIRRLEELNLADRFVLRTDADLPRLSVVAVPADTSSGI
jgi:histone acetyltransferase (RNA polymerase elongator complex component)